VPGFSLPGRDGGREFTRTFDETPVGAERAFFFSVKTFTAGGAAAATVAAAGFATCAAPLVCTAAACLASRDARVLASLAAAS